MFQEGEWVMYWIMLVGLPALGLAIAHAVVLRKWSLMGSAIGVVLVLALGIGGTLHGRRRLDESLRWAVTNVGIDSEVAERMRATGYAESNRRIQFAGIIAAVGAAFVTVGEIRRRKTAA